MMEEVKVRVYKDFNSDTLTMVIFSRESIDGRRYYGPQMSQLVKENQMVPPEMLWHFPGGIETLQKLVDAAAEQGILPTRNLPTKAEIASTERHLQDMRAIVAQALGMEFKV